MNKGQTCTFFQSEGNCPVCSDFSNRRQITGAISVLSCFSTKGLMESCPVALSGFKLDKSLITPLRSVLFSGIVVHLGFILSGKFSHILQAHSCPSLSGDKHEKKKMTEIVNLTGLLFLTFSVCMLFSESLRVEIPWLSCLLFFRKQKNFFEVKPDFFSPSPDPTPSMSAR